jgi:hypothetical protein
MELIKIWHDFALEWPFAKLGVSKVADHGLCGIIRYVNVD